MTNDELNEVFNTIVDNGWATQAELAVVTGINGYTMQSMNDVLWYLHGLDYEQLMEEAGWGIS